MAFAAHGETSDEALMVLYANGDRHAALVLTQRVTPRVLAYAARLEGAGLSVTRHVFVNVQQWPEALLQPGPRHCPCAAEVQQQLRQFFAATRCPQVM